MMRQTFILSLILAIVGLSYGMSGGGTAADPYLVTTEADLLAIDATGLSAHYRLENDIVLTGSYTTALIAAVPEGQTAGYFTGTFDGNNKTISNLTMTGGGDYLGLFGTIEYAVIRDLTMANVNINGKFRVGGLIGYARRSTVIGCQTSGTITSVSGADRTGGLIGDNWGTAAVAAVVRDCHSSVTVTGGSRVGGLIGNGSTASYIDGCSATGKVTGAGIYVGGLVAVAFGPTARATIIDSWASGDVENTGTYTGGLVGQNDVGDIVNCYAEGNVTNYGVGAAGQRTGGLAGNSNAGSYILHSHATGKVTSSGNWYTGGLVGQNWHSVIAYSYAEGDVKGQDRIGGLAGNSTGGRIIKCYAIGNVEGPGSVDGVGGLVGRMTTKGVISNSYARGNVTGMDVIGGLIGSLDGSDLINSYSTGSVAGDYDVGGLVGYAMAASNVTESFWDTQTSGTIGSAGGMGAMGRTTAQMQDPATFANWGFYDAMTPGPDETWFAPAGGNAYMKLAWKEGIPFLAGRGALDDPFSIYTPLDLQRVNTDLAGRYILMNDIDLEGAVFDAPVIGYGVDRAAFVGRFDGDGYTIKNLTIDAPTKDYVGFFSSLSYHVDFRYSSQVIGLRLDNITVTGKDYVGALVGTHEYSPTAGSTEVITNCSAENITVTGIYQVGGMIGNIRGSISGSYTTGAVVGDDRVGGLAGNTWGLAERATILTNCYSEATVTGTSYSGGLIGHASTASELYGCHATGAVTITGDRAGGLIGNTHGPTRRVVISRCYATGNVTAPNGGRVGGLAGQTYYVDISDSYATGNIIGNNMVGGLTGHNTTTSVLENCYATGTVTGYETVGGLAGSNGTDSIISNAYALGNVSGSQAVGGLVGQNHSSTIENSYALGNVEGVWRVGGLVGNNTTNQAVIRTSYATGNVSLHPDAPPAGKEFMGGLVGRNSNARIYDSFATGSVAGDIGVGGLIGKHRGDHLGQAYVENSYAIGAVSGTTDVGGFIGRLLLDNTEGASLGTQQIAGFWDTETSGTTNGIGNAADTGVTGLPTAAMMAKATFTTAGWDFIDTWWMFDGASYPNLFFQPRGIYTVAQLLAVNDNLSASYVLMNDLDLAGTTYTSAVIGTGAGANAFSGTFDGNGYSIKNLTIVHTGDFSGLFGVTEDASITNLGVVNVDIQGNYRTGGLVGYPCRSTIDGCFTTGQISGTDRVGGLVGDNWGTMALRPRILNSYSTATVNAASYAGGLVGHSSTGNYVENSYATGDVTITGDRAGGLIGNTHGAAASIGTVANCYATGDVMAPNAWRAGGLIGQTFYHTVTDSYATGNVTGGSGANDRAGGFSGHTTTGATIVNCYSTGTVTANFAGGFSGIAHAGISNSFWDTETSGLTNGIGTGEETGVTGLTTAEMMTQSTFTDAGWDFAVVWTMRDGCSYPRLVWQTFAMPDVDINLDGFIDIGDLRVLAAWWLEPGACADISGNGVVDLTDFAILAANWLIE